MMDKLERMNYLLDIYGACLTEKQRQICIDTYEEDLSLQEIAENSQISRAAVHDTLKKSEKILEDLEEKLQFLEGYLKREQLYQSLLDLNDKQVDNIVGKLKETE